MTNGYTKLFGTILTSSIWSEDDKTRLVWITMLALATRDGLVEAALPGLARAANVSVEACEASVKKLESPDEYSRSTTNDGRRIEKVDGGWRIYNYVKYMEKMDMESRRAYNARKMREYRERERGLRKQMGIRAVVNAKVTEEEIRMRDEAELVKKAGQRKVLADLGVRF